MSTPLLDITEIEKAVEATLVEKIQAIRKTAIQKDGRFIFNNPALTVSIYETGTWAKEGKYNYLVPCILNVLLIVSSAKSEEDRRRLANPLVFSIILALAQQKLGLDLKDPGIEPTGFRDVTDAEDWTANKIVYLVQFSLGFYFSVPKDEDAAADLIGIATDYLIMPGDNVADAQDETTIM